MGLEGHPSALHSVSYILMQALPGEPFYTHKASEAQKRHLLNQHAEILLELWKHPLPRIGSLFVNNDEVTVGPVTSNRFITLGTYGPFDAASEYLITILEQHLPLVAEGQLYPEYPVEAFLSFPLSATECTESSTRILARAVFPETCRRQRGPFSYR